MILTRDNMIEEFNRYTTEWKRLAAEYDRISNWRFIKQNRNLIKRQRLTAEYTKALYDSGMIKQG